MYFIEDTIPELIVIAFGLMAFALSLYTGWRFMDYPARAYLIPVSYSIGMFVYFWQVNPPLLEREFWGRIGYILFLSDICVWRVERIILNNRT